MNALPSRLLALALLLAGCAAAPRIPGSAPAPVGIPPSSVDHPGGGAAPASIVRLPERLVLPAAYRLLLLDGQLELVREADAQALEPTPVSLRVVAGEVARGELAYQPGLLPQELAREVAANRESSARMDAALADVMQRSRDLGRQAMQLEAESRSLAERVVAAEARARPPEPAKAAPPPTE